MISCTYCYADLSEHSVNDMPKHCPKCDREFTIVTPVPYSNDTIPGRAMNDIMAAEDLKVWKALHEASGTPLPDKVTPILGLGKEA